MFFYPAIAGVNFFHSLPPPELKSSHNLPVAEAVEVFGWGSKLEKKVFLFWVGEGVGDRFPLKPPSGKLRLTLGL